MKNVRFAVKNFMDVFEFCHKNMLNRLKPHVFQMLKSYKPSRRKVNRRVSFDLEDQHIPSSPRSSGSPKKNLRLPSTKLEY